MNHAEAEDAIDVMAAIWSLPEDWDDRVRSRYMTVLLQHTVEDGATAIGQLGRELRFWPGAERLTTALGAVIQPQLEAVVVHEPIRNPIIARCWDVLRESREAAAARSGHMSTTLDLHGSVGRFAGGAGSGHGRPRPAGGTAPL